MPPKRAPKAPPAPARSPAKKAPRPTATKKKQASPKPATRKEVEPQLAPKEITQQIKPMPAKVTDQLTDLLKDPSASARSVVDFVVGPTCGLESIHTNEFPFTNMTSFLLAVRFDRLDVAQLLVAEHSANTKAVHVPTNRTALHIASWFGHLEIVRWLVERCGLDVNAVDVHSWTPLHWAITRQDSEMALLLIELGTDPCYYNSQGQTPLHVACQYGLVDVAHALLTKGASPASVNAQGKTPLDIAVEYQHREVAALLGARP